MIIPKDAIINERKVRDYLLMPRTRNDKSRLLGRLGYSRENYSDLIGGIRELLPAEAEFQEKGPYGSSYAVRGTLKGPNGMTLAVKTIWILDLEGDLRFLTLIPDKEKRQR